MCRALTSSAIHAPARPYRGIHRVIAVLDSEDVTSWQVSGLCYLTIPQVNGYWPGFWDKIHWTSSAMRSSPFPTARYPSSSAAVESKVSAVCQG